SRSRAVVHDERPVEDRAGAGTTDRNARPRSGNITVLLGHAKRDCAEADAGLWNIEVEKSRAVLNRAGESVRVQVRGPGLDDQRPGESGHVSRQRARSDGHDQSLGAGDRAAKDPVAKV